MSKIKILIADDHPLMREGMTSHLQSMDFKNILIAENGHDALLSIERNMPDIAFLDIEMPGMSGLDVARASFEKNLNTRIVILSVHREPSFVLRARELKVTGYLLKDDAIDEIEKCILELGKGNQYFSSSILNQENQFDDPITSKISSLTPSEGKILKLIAKKMTTQEIAEFLFISDRTVEKHRSNIIRKLELPRQTHVLKQWVFEHLRYFQ